MVCALRRGAYRNTAPTRRTGGTRDVTRLGIGGSPPKDVTPPQTGTVIGLFCTAAVLDIMLL